MLALFLGWRIEVGDWNLEMGFVCDNSGSGGVCLSLGILGMRHSQIVPSTTPGVVCDQV